MVLFCIDCSESMLELREDPKYENVQTCHLFTALEAAVEIQKRKIIVGPNDSVGILLFNIVRFLGQGSCLGVMSFKGPERQRRQQWRLGVEEERLFVSTYNSNERSQNSRDYAAPRRSVCTMRLRSCVLKRVCSRERESE